MLLSDNEIRARLDEFALTVSNPNFSFDAARQIQPCSIDLRLSEVFWTPKRFRRIDLSDTTPLGPKISRAFKRRRMTYPKGYWLRPGQFVLCSTYERFAIPRDLCGRLVGRSSVGRMGLIVSAASNFINPGWEGQMPVVIANLSNFPIRLHPYIGIVQLCLIKLSSPASRVYGDEGVGSKYTNDDGGPSRYWLDYSIRALRENLNLQNSSPQAEAFLEAYIHELDDPTRARFLKVVKKYGFIGSASDFIAHFVRRERLRTPVTYVITIAGSALISLAIRVSPNLFGLGPIGWGLAFAPVIAVGIAVGWVYLRLSGTTMSPNDLRKLAREIEARVG